MVNGFLCSFVGSSCIRGGARDHALEFGDGSESIGCRFSVDKEQLYCVSSHDLAIFGKRPHSLKAIPQGAWLALAGVELLFALCLILPAFYKSVALLVPSAAICIAVIMLLFCAIHFSAGNTGLSSPAYWLVVAALGAFIAYGRLVLRPF